MGKYINKDFNGKRFGNFHKVASLKAMGAVEIERPTQWREGIVCVANGPMWDAAIYCYSPAELNYILFAESSDERQYTWLYFEKAKDLAE